MSLKKYINYKARTTTNYLQYKYCLATNKPYFGPHLKAGQLTPKRQEAITALLTKVNPYYAFEVGCWAGQSTCTIIDRCEVLYTCDPWMPYRLSECNPGKNRAYGDILDTGLIEKLFFHNLKAMGCLNKNIHYKLVSNAFWDYLLDGNFEFGFIDGNHLFHQVMKDIQNALPKLTKGGILCGDDFEKSYHQVKDKDLLHASLYEDFIMDADGVGYHPGVTLAIHKLFNSQVETKDGLWWVKR